MKWGVRRYQNADGSLTAAGKKRYSPEVQSSRESMKTAKAVRDSAEREFNKAYRKYEMLPTNANYRRMMDASNKLKSTKQDYRTARLDYKVAKTDAVGGFDTGAKKSKHRRMLEEKFRNQGYDDKQAAVLANDRIRTEKIVAGAAALTITAAAAYAANQRVKNRTDQILKSGTLLQRIEMTNTNGKLHDEFYTSTGKHDNKRYEGVLGFTRKMQSGEAYIMKLKANRDIKVASKDRAIKEFGDLYKNDSNFRFAVREYVGHHPMHAGKNKVDVSDLSDRNIRKMYDNFNSGLIHIRESGSGADKMFYNKLKSAGYDAIQDINDMKYSGYRARNPLIVFNNTNNAISVKSMKDLTTGNNLGAKAAVELGKGEVEKMVGLFTSPYTAAATSGAAAYMYVSDHKGVKSNRTQE